MAVETVPGHDATYHLVSYDARGRERQETDGRYSDVVLSAATTSEPTDVFVFSHGWNGDVPAARRQYGAWVATMLECAADRDLLAAAPGGFRPMLVGLHWPSKAWGDEEFGPASFGIAQAAGPERDVDAVIDLFASRLADTSSMRHAVRTIIEAALQDAAPRSLPAPVRQAYQVIDAEAGIGATGEGTPPGDDREPFDPERMYQGCLRAEAVSFGGRSLGGILAPLRVLTFWQMKGRARTFGETGAADLLGSLQQACPDARFHLMGHSFGCIVAAAALAGPPGSPKRRPVSTLTLVQGAMSLWSFCSSIPDTADRQGYFRRVVADSLVTGPTVVTTSVHDRAVGMFYPLGAWSGRQVDYGVDELPRYGGIGTYGVQGPDVEVKNDVLGRVDTTYDLVAGRVHNLDARDVVALGSGLSGAHSDICHPEVAHAVWQAVAVDARAPR